MEAQDSNSDSDDVTIVSVTERPVPYLVPKRPRPSQSPDHTHKRPKHCLSDSDDALPRDKQKPWKIKDDFPNKDLMELDLPQYHRLLQQDDSEDKGPHLPIKPAKQIYDTALSVIACTHPPCRSTNGKATPTDIPVVINYESLRNMFCVSVVKDDEYFDELNHQLHSSPVLSFENKGGPPVQVCLKESEDTISTGKVVFDKSADTLDHMLLHAAGTSQDGGHTSHDNHTHQYPPVDHRENLDHAPTSSHTHQDPPVDPHKSHDHAPINSHTHHDLPMHQDIPKPAKDHTHQGHTPPKKKQRGRHKRAKFFIQPLATPSSFKPAATPPVKQPVTPPCKQPVTPPNKQPVTSPSKQPVTPPCKQPATPPRKQPPTPRKQPVTPPIKQRSKPPPKHQAMPPRPHSSEPLPFMFSWPLVRAGLTGNMDAYLRTLPRPPKVNPLLAQTEEVMSKLQRGATPGGSSVTLSKEYINKRRRVREEALKKLQLTDQQKAAIKEELYAGGDSIVESFRPVSSHAQQLVTNDYTVPVNIASIIERYWMKLAMESKCA